MVTRDDTVCREQREGERCAEEGRCWADKIPPFHLVPSVLCYGLSIAAHERLVKSSCGAGG